MPIVIESSANRFYGKYRGTVQRNEDPDQLGRITATVPEILGDTETGWAIPALPLSGEGVGFYCVPKPGTGVWIEFESGNVSRPLWSGCWWGGGQVPEQSEPNVVILKTTAGHMIKLDDTGGEEKVEILEKSGAKIIMESAEIEISKGSQKITISQGAVSINEGALEVV